MKKNEFNYIVDKLDILDDRLDELEKISLLQEENLKQHMKRTKLLEDDIGPLNKFMYGAYGIIGFLVLAGAYTSFIK